MRWRTFLAVAIAVQCIPCLADHDYFTIADLPTPSQRLDDARRWAAQYGGEEVSFSRSASRFNWPEYVRYVYLSQSGGIRVAVDPILRQQYSCSRTNSAASGGVDSLAISLGPATDSMAAAMQLIDLSDDLRTREWVRMDAAAGWVSFRELLSPTVVGASTCGFRFRPNSTSLLAAGLDLRDADLTTEPVVSFSAAAELVQNHVAAEVGDWLVSVEPTHLTHQQRPLEMAMEEVDDLQLRRLGYVITAVIAQNGAIDREEYLRVQSTWDSIPVNERPLLHYPCFFVDAMTGEIQEIHQTYGLLGTGPTGLHLEVDGTSIHSLYPPIVVDEQAYVYVEYLDSFLWSADIDAHGRTLNIFHDGMNWHINSTSGRITCDRRELPQTAEPLHGRLYLPVAAIEEITGWKMIVDLDDRMLDMIPPPPVRSELDLLRG